MRKLKTLLVGIVALSIATVVFAIPNTADAKKIIKIRVQSVIPSKADEVVMLKDFAANVKALTDGEVVIEVLPAGAIVGVKETLEAVDKGLIEGGFAWTHYWSGYHPAAMLFGSPVAGAGVGIDNIAWISWYMNGGGRALYEQLWKEMGMDIKGFMLQPVGPEALGWFKEPINSMADFRKLRFRTPPGIPGHNDELEPLPFDPELARQLIAESKYGSIDNLPSIVFYGLYSLGPTEQAMVGMWQANLGVTVEVQIIEELEEWLELSHNRELPLFVSGWHADYIDPQNFLEILFHSQSEDNISAYSNSEVDAALEKAAVEQDEEARLKMYQDIEKMILKDLPLAPFYQSSMSHVLVKPYVEEYYLAPIGIHIWKYISVKPH